MKDGIESKIKEIIDENFDVTDINYVPDIDNSRLTFGNKGLRFYAATLYIDMRGSTSVLNNHNRKTVAKLHKAYFHTIVTIAKSLDGQVRSFNGDGMLVFFEGNSTVSINKAVKAAMKMKYMLASSDSKVKKKMEKYTSINFGIGIDFGKIICTKVGISGSNNRDLVWVGHPVNKSVKIGDNLHNVIGISSMVYNNLSNETKYHIKKEKHWFTGELCEDKVNMWEEDTFNYNGNEESYYETTYHWSVD